MKYGTKYGTVMHDGECRDVYAGGYYTGMNTAFMYGAKNVLGYWETLFDMFSWACDECGFDYEESEWVDGFTGEVLDYWDVLDMDYEEE